MLWAKKMEDLGAGEILLTSMDQDGVKSGYDLGVTRAISEAVNVPVIASGGVGNLEHLAAGILEGKADAVLAASIFHFGEYTVPEAKATWPAAVSWCAEARCAAAHRAGDRLAIPERESTLARLSFRYSHAPRIRCR